MIYTGKVRFRVGLFGKLILQVEYLDGDMRECWIDARVEELNALGRVVTTLQQERGELK